MSALQSLLHEIRHNPLMLRVYLPATLFTTAESLLTPVLPLYAAGFDISYGMIGFILAGRSLGMLIGDLPGGPALRRYGTRRVLLASLSGLALTTGALFLAQSVLVVVLLSVLAGICKAFAGIALHTYLADRVAVQQRGRAIAVYGGTIRVGGFLGPALGGLIAATFGLRTAFLAFALIAIAAALIIQRTHPGLAESEASNVPIAQAHEHNLFAIMRGHSRVLLTAGGAALFGQMVRAGRQVFIPLYAADVLGLSVDAIGLLVSISVAIDTLMFPLAGIIMDRYGRKWAIIPCFAGQALAMAMVPLTTDFASLLGVASLMGASNGLGAGSMMTLGADLAPPAARGEFLGAWRLINDTGIMGAPLLVGGVADLFTLPMAALVMAGSGLISAGMFGAWVPETLKRKQQSVPA